MNFKTFYQKVISKLQRKRKSFMFIVVVGSLKRWGEGDDIDYHQGYEHLKKAIIDNANTDVYIILGARNMKNYLNYINL